jgi:hypothetical protein
VPVKEQRHERQSASPAINSYAGWGKFQDQPVMPFEKRFSNDQLVRIMDEAAVYLCACPAQVCKQILGLRELYAYQQNCLLDGNADQQVHTLIAASAVEAHRGLEECLAEIIRIEGWDMQTLKMPANLRRLRDSYIASL